MKGRASFTPDEARQIRALLREVRQADRPQQKTLRSRLRRIGFYITDWTTDQQGFTEADFNDLASRGLVTIEDPANPAPMIRNQPPTVRPHRPAPQPSPPPTSASAAEARQRRAQAAAKYRPDPIDLLLVAEAPPSSLDRYFYFQDVQEHDSLFRYVVRTILGTETDRANKPHLLQALTDRGVYLIDLIEDPIRPGDRHATYVPGLIERCRSLHPRTIILIKTTVYDAAYRPMKDAGLPVINARIPFPGSGQQRRFVEAFTPALQAARTAPPTDPSSDVPY